MGEGYLRGSPRPTGATAPTTWPASPCSSRAATPRCVSRPYAADGLSAVSAASGTAPAPTPTPTPVAAKPTPPKPPRDPGNIGVLVNKTHPLKPKSYVPKGLVRVQGQRLRAEPAAALDLPAPVVLLDGRPAGPVAWVSMLAARLTQHDLEQHLVPR